MAPDVHDRWLFLLTFAAIPLACTEDLPEETTSGETTGTTTTPLPMDTSEGATSIVTTTGLDGTSSSGGETTADSSSSGMSSSSDSSSSDATTMSIDPSTSSSESSSTTGEPQGLCEVWGETLAGCYGYYNPAYLVNYCYEYLMGVDVMCGPVVGMYYQCQASGCFVDCSDESEAVQDCNELLQVIELGCDMIPIVPGVGTIDAQCMGVVDQAEVCTAGGYYIPGFSSYIMYAPEYTQYFCVNGAYFTYLFPPPGIGDACGGAYEELLTCLSGLSCGDFEDALYDDTICGTEKNAVTCRCELDA